MLYLSGIVASAAEPETAQRLHEVSHRDGLEYLEIARRDAARRRLRARTDRGTDCAVALPRDRQLENGDVLLLEPDRAIVVRIGAERWLRLSPRDGAVALRLGYHAGNLHWRARFDGADLLIAMEGGREAYLARLTEFLERGDIEVRNDD